MTLGSLFDGSGGFPLAASLCGIQPVWASEIEPYPLRVTAARFPSMEQLGDVTKINGAEIMPVDVITFSSPCQDLSVSGNMEGLHGGRSSLFFEAIRIIKEMRSATNGKYPKYIVWENVLGAFVSNKGTDFRTVLEQILGVIESRNVDVPQPKKWMHAGYIESDHGSVAYRVLDAQYWGIPARRRRIFLVADLTGQRAGKILFERKGLPGNDETRGRAPQNNSTAPDGCAYEAVEFNPTDARLKITHDVFQTITARLGTGGNQGPLVYEEVLSVGNGQPHQISMSDKANCLDCMHDQQAILVDGRLRRITPLEACRLQGFPNIAEVNMNEITRDELCALALAEGFIKVDFSTGDVYANRGPGGIIYGNYRILTGSMCNGYKVYSLHFGGSKKQVKGHRLVWIAAHGMIPDGFVVDHINNDKTDNRIANLQLLTARDNSTKAKNDGLYRVKEDAPQAKITNKEHDAIQYIYFHTDLTAKRLSEIFGISDSRVQQIIHEGSWEDGVKGSDGARYKMWGNGVALPCVKYIMHGIAECEASNEEEI